MAFLIGVLVLIGFIIFCYLFVKTKVKNYFGVDLKTIISEARLEDEEVPKSLSSMDRIYLEQIKRDFCDININELKRMSEKLILDCYSAIEKKDSSLIKNEKVKSFVDAQIDDLGSSKVSYSDFKFHNTVVAKYEKSKGIATIYFDSSFQYIYEKDNKSKKVQDRARSEFIYIIDVDQLPISKKNLGINCPNCGGPLKSLGDKKCSYCGGLVIDIVKRVWVCNDIVRY